MGTTAELELSKYEVDELSADQFYNIVNFAKNMTIKDSKYFEETETALSKRFADLMIKYFDSGLSVDEMGEIVSFIKEYNNKQNNLVCITENGNQIVDNAIGEPSILEIEKPSSLSYEGNTYVLEGIKYIFNKELIIEESDEITLYYNEKKYLYRKNETKLIGCDNQVDEVLSNNMIVLINLDEYIWNDEGYFYTKIELPTNIIIKIDRSDYFWNGETFYKPNINDYEWTETKNGISKTYKITAKDNLEERLKRYGLNNKNSYKSSILNLIMTELRNFSPTEVEEYYSEIQTYLFLNFFKEISTINIEAISLVDNSKIKEWYEEYGYINIDEKKTEKTLENIIISEGDAEPVKNTYLSKYIFYKLDEKNNITGEYIIQIDNDGKYILKDRKDSQSSTTVDIGGISNLKFKFNNKFWSVSEFSINDDSGKKIINIKINIDARETLIGHIRITLDQEIRNLKEAYLNKNKFIIKIPDEPAAGTKNIASEEERILLKNSNLIFMNFIYNPECDSENNSGRYLVLYKELNPRYRSLFEYDMIDLTLNFKNPATQGDNTTGGILKNRFKDSIISGMTNYLRTIRESNILIKDFSNINSTTKDFKYIYGNPYYARKASESEVIKYFINNPRIPNTNSVNGYGYGVWSYEKEEIYSFLEIYQNIHDYFYKVLLNESFVNESEYKIFEKTFLIFWSIERFITYKIDNLKDINLMDMTDTKNFLTSYGLGELAEIIEKNTFYDAEVYSKNILKRFIDIVQNKGTHKVLNILQEVFSDSNSELVIFNSILEYKEEDREEKYYFFETLYGEENRLKAIFDNEGKKTEMGAYTANDNLWNAEEDTSVEVLKDLGVYNTQTKYLIPQLTEEISESFFMTRYVFAIIDFIADYFASNEQLEDIAIESAVFGPQNISSFINNIRKSLREFLLIKEKTNSNDTSLYKNSEYTFKISKDNLLNCKYFKLNLDANNNIDSSEPIIIDRVALKNDFSLKIEEYSVATESFLEELFGSLRYILVFQYLFQDDSTLKVEDKLILLEKYITPNSINDIGQISEIINSILEFVKIIHKGPNEVPLSNLPWIKSELFAFLQKIHDETFMITPFSKIENIIIDTKNNQDYNPSIISEESIDVVIQNIIKSCTELSEILVELIQIRVTGTEEAILKFLKETIDYFIAYSAMVYKTIYKVEYRTTNEFLHITDDIHFMKTMQDIDSFYYDESLSIQLEDK